MCTEEAAERSANSEVQPTSGSSPRGGLNCSMSDAVQIVRQTISGTRTSSCTVVSGAGPAISRFEECLTRLSLLQPSADGVGPKRLVEIKLTQSPISPQILCAQLREKLTGIAPNAASESDMWQQAQELLQRRTVVSVIAIHGFHLTMLGKSGAERYGCLEALAGLLRPPVHGARPIHLVITDWPGITKILAKAADRLPQHVKFIPIDLVEIQEPALSQTLH